VNLIFNLLVLQGLLTTAYKVGFCLVDETLPSKEIGTPTMGVVVLLLCLEFVDKNTLTTALG